MDGATADVTDKVSTAVILLGFHAGNLPHFSLHDYSGILMGFQQMVMK